MEASADVERIDSEEWASLRRPIVASSEDGALELGALYFSELRRMTRRLIRYDVRGQSSALVLLETLTLFVFGAPEARVGANEIECRLPIVDGLLVAEPGGALRVIQRTSPDPELGLVVSGYVPRLTSRRRHSLRRFLYTNVQRRLHTFLSRRFLDRVAADAG